MDPAKDIVNSREAEASTDAASPSLSREALAVHSHVGAVLDAARESDRAWREQRSQAMQLRLEQGERRLRWAGALWEWSWRCMSGGGLLLVLCSLGFYLMRDRGVPGWLLLPVCGSLLVITLLGLVLLPVSKLLQATVSLRQEQLLQQADRDQLEI